MEIAESLWLRNIRVADDLIKDINADIIRLLFDIISTCAGTSFFPVLMVQKKKNK